MRYFLIVFLLVVALDASAGGRKRYRGEPRSEVGLMNNVLGCLSHKDSVGYFYLFPPFDTLWKLVVHHPDNSPAAQRDLSYIKENPKLLLQYDPMYNHKIMAGFLNALTKGEDSGIHWNRVVMQRYELSRQVPTSNELVGYSRIVPERFRGYMFVRDMLGRLTFCISITEIQKINGYFFGGQILNILEAANIEEFHRKEEEERKYFEWLARDKTADSAVNDSLQEASLDSLAKADSIKKANPLNVSPSDDDTFKARREVVDRRYYEGWFDEEIQVKLYVRYMKDLRTGKISAYDGLYKFGDQMSYVRLNIIKNPDGKWIMEDDPPIGNMELELANRVYTGSWNNNENQTGYDVELKQTDIEQKRLERLDNILDRGLSGRTDQANSEEKKSKPKEDGKDKGDEKDKGDGNEKTKDKEKEDDKPKKQKKPKRNWRDYDD
ncbi:MAG: hypothetical protein K0Q79_139 [Flavipsychrobacter sp.]|jgi:hypothetical protein|nr:hypothetical protein [Flavipsychrobacter sp.]